MTKTVDETPSAATSATTEALKGSYAKMQAAGTMMSDANKANMEALMESSKITFKSFKDAGAITGAYAKDATAKATVAFKALTGSKSIQEAVEVHADYTRGALDSYFSEFNRVADVFLGAMKAASKPISDRASANWSAMQAAK